MIGLPTPLRGLRDRPTLVILSQVYVPDPAAVGQYMHDVARAIVERGQRVVVFTADRGYEEPSTRHPHYERIDGVHVVRLPLSSFGKRSLGLRLLGGSLFVSEATVLAASLPRVDAVLVSTSPPMCALAGLALKRLRGARLTFWAMDINPDQIVATGRLAPSARPVRALDWLNRQTIAASDAVVTLDDFMAARLRRKLAFERHIHVIPPWPLFDDPRCSQADVDRKRAELGFQGRRVVMYSGNLSPVHPIDTCLKAADALRRDPHLSFAFAGGGLGRAQIESYVRAQRLTNVKMLPYQPLGDLALALSAADLHLVAMGEAMVGVVHPSKIYNAMAVGRPIFAIAPKSSHVGELVLRHGLGWHVAHGEVDRAVGALGEFARADPGQLLQLSQRARMLASNEYSRRSLLERFCTVLDHANGETTLDPSPVEPATPAS